MPRRWRPSSSPSCSRVSAPSAARTSPPRGRCGRGRSVALSRAFGNLVDNALRYGNAARVRLTVRTAMPWSRSRTTARGSRRSGSRRCSSRSSAARGRAASRPAARDWASPSRVRSSALMAATDAGKPGERRSGGNGRSAGGDDARLMAAGGRRTPCLGVTQPPPGQPAPRVKGRRGPRGTPSPRPRRGSGRPACRGLRRRGTWRSAPRSTAPGR